jgi:NADPH:quinone reductase-like Zn-dependent oxidoreductase
LRDCKGVNPVDFKIRNGQYPAVKEDRLPYTLGRDVSGIIEKCGAQATQFKVGGSVGKIVLSLD